MTKKVRIENADNSNHKVRVYVERKNSEGQWVREANPNDTKALDHPTSLEELWIHGSQRLVVEEASE